MYLSYRKRTLCVQQSILLPFHQFQVYFKGVEVEVGADDAADSAPTADPTLLKRMQAIIMHYHSM